MITEVTAGCSSTNASARSISERPASSASSPSAYRRLELDPVRRQCGSCRPAALWRDGRRVPAAPIAAREPAAGERAPRDHAEAVALGDGQQLALDPPGQDRVRRLLGDRPLAVPALGDPLRLDDLRRLERRGAEVADLALVDQVGERAERLVEVGLRTGRCTW